MGAGAGPAIVLHVGTPKTGTTYLQDVLWRNRRVLRRRGVLYPGDQPEAHFLATMDLQGATATEVGDTDLPGAWSRLARQVREWPGTAVVSHELLSPMGADRIARARADLGPAELHVVCTVRDLARQLPAGWQEDLKNRHALSFGEFVEAVRAPERGHWLGELFWSMQDPVEVLRRWADGLPPDRVHVVTVPRPGAPPRLLWERFAAVLGVHTGGLDATPGAPNSSLGPAEAHLLRRLNLALDPDLPWAGYEATVRQRVVDLLARCPGDAARLAIPAGEAGWVAERSHRIVEELRVAGYHVVGDLDELLPAPPPVATHPDEVSDAEVLDAAVEVLRRLVEHDAQSAGPPRGRWSPVLRRRVRELSERHATVMLACAAYRSLRRSKHLAPDQGRS